MPIGVVVWARTLSGLYNFGTIGAAKVAGSIIDWRNKEMGRQASVTRQTKEMHITCHLELDGSGKATVSTGLSDHMLDALVRHSRIDLELKAQGDLEVDDHQCAECLPARHLRTRWETVQVFNVLLRMRPDEALVR